MLRAIAKLIDSKLDNYCVGMHDIGLWKQTAAGTRWVPNKAIVALPTRVQDPEKCGDLSKPRYANQHITLRLSDLAIILNGQQFVVIKNRYGPKMVLYLASPVFLDRLDELLEPFRIEPCLS